MIKRLERPRIRTKEKRKRAFRMDHSVDRAQASDYIYPDSNFITFPMDAIKVQAENLRFEVSLVYMEK